MGLEDLLVQIKHEVERFGARRVVVDSMTALEHNAPVRAFGEFGVGLSGFLKARSVAGLVTTTIDSLLGGVSVTGVALSTVADSIIALRYLELDGQLRRGILVVKLRGQSHDRAIHEYEITDHGFHILAPFRGVAGILTGRASFLGDEPSAIPAQGDTGEPGGM